MKGRHVNSLTFILNHIIQQLWYCVILVPVQIKRAIKSKNLSFIQDEAAFTAQLKKNVEREIQNCLQTFFKNVFKLRESILNGIRTKCFIY